MYQKLTEVYSCWISYLLLIQEHSSAHRGFCICFTKYTFGKVLLHFIPLSTWTNLIVFSLPICSQSLVTNGSRQVVCSFWCWLWMLAVKAHWWVPHVGFLLGRTSLALWWQLPWEESHTIDTTVIESNSCLYAVHCVLWPWKTHQYYD